MRKTDVWKIGKKTIAAIAVFAMVFSVFVGMNALNGKAEVFGTDVQVSDDDGGFAPDIALSSTGTIYVAFEDDYAGLDFANSTDGGNSFSAQIFVAGSSSYQYHPAVAAYGENNVYVVWDQDYKIYYARSTNHGDSFEAPVQVSDATTTWCENPDIAVDSNGVIYVVWEGNDASGNYRIFIDKSTFGTDVPINPIASVVEHPSIAIDSANNILVAWDGSDHVYYAKSTDGSADSFSAPVQVDDSDTGASNPSIGVDAYGKIFVAWQDGRNLDGGDIYAAVLPDGSTSFNAGVLVNTDATDTAQKFPSLAVHPCGKVFVAWQDERDGDAKIYFANSTDGGATFGTNVLVSDETPATSPSLAVGDDTEVYVVWRNSDSDLIYFDQAPDATWPNAVAGLEVVDATTDSLTINWTAPGDNFALGTATTYDIRYSEATIDETNWADATPVSTPPTPQVGGTAETFTVGSLNNDTTYYFALKTSDEVPNTSPLSNIASGKTLDDWAPAAVTDLAASDPTSSSIKLTWTAPGDNGNTGTAAEYDIRYSESEINDTNWADAIQCTGEPTPSIAGTTETFVVTGLVMNTTYYFALMTADDTTPTPNWSPLSIVATNKTTTNTPPVASNLVITPTAPKTTDDLVGTYVYFDAETDAESGTEIRWYKDDVLQTAYNDTDTIPSTATAKGEVWNFTVRPRDGTDFGELEFLTVTILNSDPVANFTISPAGPYYPDAVITFNASTSADPDGNADIVNYTWNVSGEIKYGLEVDYTFTTLGTFDVILTVKDASDVTNTTTKQVTIESPNEPPVANFTISAAPYYRSAVITFTSTSTDPDGIADIVNYTWNINGVIKYGAEVTHTFTTLGTFDVTLTVKDSYGETDTIPKQITIENQAPTASFTVSETEVEAGVEITFTSTSTDPDTDTLTYLWDFGDEKTSTEANPKHTYESAGTYTVTLTVDDGNGGTDTYTTEITIKEKTDIWLYVAIIIIIVIIIVAVAAVVMKKKKKPEAVPETEE